MTLPASIRVNVRSPFPSRVQGAAFIQVTKANGIWTIAPNYELLAQAPSLTGTQVVVVFDPTIGQFSLLNATNMAGNGPPRVVTAAGDVTVGATDIVILLDKTVGAATNINLPPSGSRSASVSVKDIKGDAHTNNITFVPAAGETIDGFSAAAAAANGTALIDINYGKKTVCPLSSGGWYVL